MIALTNSTKRRRREGKERRSATIRKENKQKWDALTKEKKKERKK